MEKIYLIIGATSDIAKAYIKELNKSGEKTTVIALYVGNNEELIKLNNSLENVEIDLVECDLSNIETVKKAIEYVKEKYNSPTHILHLAARKFEYVKFTKLDWENVMLDMEIQVHSFAEILKVFLPIMSKNKYGKIVAMLSSVTKGVPPKYLSGYVITKYALMGLLNSLVSEYKEKGIQINAVSPTMVETQFLSNIDERIVEMTANNSSLKRNVKIEEVVAAIKYLMSDEAEYVNGLNLSLTSGDII